MTTDAPSGIDDTDDVHVDESSNDSTAAQPRRRRTGPEPRWKRETHRWARTLHVYTSLIALLVVLFFGFSGLTLNHPTWTFGDKMETRTETGTLPANYKTASGEVDFLAVSEYVRNNFDVAGRVDSYDVLNGQGTIAYKNPGYAADLFFQTDTGAFELRIQQQGWVGVMNDLHKGRDARPTWKWVIDISAVFLVVISLTGLLMQFFLRKRRRSALIGAAAGAVLVIILMLITLR